MGRYGEKNTEIVQRNKVNQRINCSGAQQVGLYILQQLQCPSSKSFDGFAGANVEMTARVCETFRTVIAVNYVHLS